MSFLFCTALSTWFDESIGLFSRSISIISLRFVSGSRLYIWLFLAINRFNLVTFSKPSKLSIPLLEISSVVRLLSECMTFVSSFFRQLYPMFKISSVLGRLHISLIWLPDKFNFLRKGRLSSSGTSDYSRLPLTSSSVRFLKRPISLRCVTLRLTKRNVIKLEGFFTSVKLFTGTVVWLEFENEEAESLTWPPPGPPPVPPL